MRWRKLGRVFAVDGRRPWMLSHASVPIAEPLGNDLFRVYFTSRDDRNRSHTGWFVLDITRPGEVLDLSDEPVLAPGPLGAFDADGAMATWLVRHRERRFLYYIGWNRAVGVPFRNSIGLAIADQPGTTFRRLAGPVLDRSPFDPYFVASQCVLIEEASWHMWYLSGLDWQGDPPQCRYNLRYAVSRDGVDWMRTGAVAVDFEHRGEIAIARPSVLRDGDLWRMWFCFRGKTFPYRLGYAESYDAVRWRRRDDDAGLAVSEDGWDSEMICYPFVFDHAGARYMLYNGNGYGRSGIGLAVLETP